MKKLILIFSLFGLLMSSYGQLQVPAVASSVQSGSSLLNDLVGYWKLDEASGTLYDQTANNNDGATTGITYGETGIINDAISSDGNDYVTITHSASLNISGDISCSFWIWNPLGEFVQKILTKPFGLSVVPYYFEVTYYQPGFRIYDTDWVTNKGTNAIATDEWEHVVITVNTVTDEIKYYINGVVDGDVDTGVTSLPTNTEDVSLLIYQGPPYYATCRLDELGLWSKVLTQAEVTELYNSNSGLSYPF